MAKDTHKKVTEDEAPATPQSQDEPQGVSVDQAIAMLSGISQRGYGDVTLRLVYDPGHSTLGPTPTVPVTGIYKGIDWDKNVLLSTTPKLGPAGKELEILREKVHKMGEALSWARMQLKDNRLTDAQKLQEIEYTLSLGLKNT